MPFVSLPPQDEGALGGLKDAFKRLDDGVTAEKVRLLFMF
jgi:hypothetical protein